MQSEATRPRPGPTVRFTSAALDNAVMLREDVCLELSGESASITGPVTAIMLRPVRDGVRTALSRLATGPTTLPQLFAGLTPAECAQVQRFLDRSGPVIARSVLAGGHELMRMEQTERQVDHRARELEPDTPVRLSPFAFCRSRANTLVLESPLAKLRVLLVHRDAQDLVAELGTAHTCAELAGDRLSLAEICALTGHLAGAGFVETGDQGGQFGSDTDPTLRQWDFHDLLFHSRIRSGGYDDPFGAVYPHAGQIDPVPAVKAAPAGPAVNLYRPSLEDLMARDPGITVAIEARRSIRDYGERPLDVRQLGEFLYRTGRVRAHHTPPAPDRGDEVVSRPYPSGGGAYELECYLTVRRCDGLDPGIYYYDPVAHQLILVNDDVTDRQSMLNVAAAATGVASRPDVLITITARFQRLSWKYRAIAYATMLRHTGVLYQTMYLVATAMGLAACGLGNGDAGMSARVLGLDYLRESSVGDFILGSRRPGDSVAGPVAPGWRMVNSPEWALRAAELLPEPQ